MFVCKVFSTSSFEDWSRYIPRGTNLRSKVRCTTTRRWSGWTNHSFQNLPLISTSAKRPEGCWLARYWHWHLSVKVFLSAKGVTISKYLDWRPQIRCHLSTSLKYRPLTMFSKSLRPSRNMAGLEKKTCHNFSSLSLFWMRCQSDRLSHNCRSWSHCEGGRDNIFSATEEEEGEEEEG